MHYRADKLTPHYPVINQELEILREDTRINFEKFGFCLGFAWHALNYDGGIFKYGLEITLIHGIQSL